LPGLNPIFRKEFQNLGELVIGPGAILFAKLFSGLTLQFPKAAVSGLLYSKAHILRISTILF
jgi:hypothetical protein